MSPSKDPLREHRRSPPDQARSAVASEARSSQTRPIADELGFEERLHRSEEHLLEMFDNTSDGILIHRGLQYVYANPAALRLVGRAHDEVVGHSPFELVPPRFRLRLAERIMEAYTTHAPMPEEEEHLLHAGGTEVPVDVVTVPIVYGGELATLVHIRNITARRELEVRLRATDRLASAGLVAAGVAHEIQRPLVYALSDLETLRARLVSSAGELTELVASIYDNVERAVHAARDSGVFITTQRTRPGRVDIHQVLDACVSFLGPELRSQVNLVRDYGDVPPVQGDSSRLAHVFLNLLKNAVQAMSQRTRCANDVTITTSSIRDGRVLVAIKDTGVGLHPEVQRAIFEPLFTTRPHAVGLGLALSRSLVEDEQGELTVESEMGSGTTFRVALRAASHVELEESPHERASGKRILVVEDEPRLCATLRRILAGHRTTIVRNCHEALQHLHAGESYDLVICDLTDNFDGIDLHRRIRAEWPGFQQRMIFLTGDAFISRTQEFLASIPNGHLQKPFEPIELLDLVDDVLEGHC
jgi:PAS domain S-box-containing protein